MRSKLLVILIIGIIGATAIAATIAYRPKSRYAFGGTWVGKDLSEGLSSIFYYHISPVDIVGKREFSFYMNHLNLDARLDGVFPEAVIYADGVGRGYATGKDTFTYNSLICALNATGFVEYYMIGSGIGRWINKDEQIFDQFTVSLYLPSHDVEPYDGLPYEGQQPIMCVEFPLYLQRIPYFPPCTPT